MKCTITHRINDAVLFSLECRSFKECVEAGVKARADLAGANLGGAYLRDAYLRDANLAGANLAGANLEGVYQVIDAGTPNGWRCVGWLQDGWLSIRVGCHNKRLDEGLKYWAGKENRREVLIALDYVEAVAKIRGWRTQ